MNSFHSVAIRSHHSTMVRTYTPEERAERRRRSSVKREIKPLIDDEEDEESEASWIADLRAQGVDVAEFLSEALPEVIDIPAEVITQDEESINLEDTSDDRRENTNNTRKLLAKVQKYKQY